MPPLGINRRRKSSSWMLKETDRFINVSQMAYTIRPEG
jgi:hypothetical protein